MTPVADSLFVRSAVAVSEGTARGQDPAPPLAWSLDGSLAGGLLARLRGLRPLLGRASGLAASAADLPGRRPLLLLLVVFAALPVVRFLSSPQSGTAAATVLLGLAGFGFLSRAASTLHTGREGRWVLAALLAGLLLRFAAALVLTAAGGLPDETGLYHPLAADAEACWRAGGPSLLADHSFSENRSAYLYLLASTYLVTGPALMAGRMLGILLGLAVALLAGELGRPLGGPRAAALAVVLLALHPEHAFWSASLSRDGLTTVVVLLALASLARRPGSLFRGGILAPAAAVALLAWNSFPFAGILAATVVVLAIAEAVAAAASRGPRIGAVLIAGAVLLGAALLLVVGRRYGNYFTPDLLTAVRRNTLGNAPDFLPGMVFEGPLSVLLFLPLGVVFVLFAPWPWAAAGGSRFLYGIGALAGAAVAMIGIAGWGAGLRRRPSAAAPAVIFLLLSLALLGLLEANSGIVVRHRLPLTAVLAAGAGALLAGLGEPRRA